MSPGRAAGDSAVEEAAAAAVGMEAAGAAVEAVTATAADGTEPLCR